MLSELSRDKLGRETGIEAFQLQILAQNVEHRVTRGEVADRNGDGQPDVAVSDLPGMERLGTVVDNLLTGRVLQRGSPIPELVAMLLLPLLTVWLLVRLPARQAALALLLVMLLCLLVAQVRFQWHSLFYSLAFPFAAGGLAVLGGALLRSHREGVMTLHEKNPNMGVLVITHYQRLLNYIKPQFVHVLIDGRTV